MCIVRFKASKAILHTVVVSTTRRVCITLTIDAMNPAFKPHSLPRLEVPPRDPVVRLEMPPWDPVAVGWSTNFLIRGLPLGNLQAMNLDRRTPTPLM